MNKSQKIPFSALKLFLDPLLKLRDKLFLFFGQKKIYRKALEYRWIRKDLSLRNEALSKTEPQKTLKTFTIETITSKELSNRYNGLITNLNKGLETRKENYETLSIASNEDKFIIYGGNFIIEIQTKTREIPIGRDKKYKFLYDKFIKPVLTNIINKYKPTTTEEIEIVFKKMEK